MMHGLVNGAIAAVLGANPAADPFGRSQQDSPEGAGPCLWIAGFYDWKRR